jgi:exopolysaccharide biosynthesis polyprenyl glycosylphosphotransferase
MFAYRQRGLVTLHAAAACGSLTALLPLYALFLPYLPRVQLNESIDLLPYCLAVFAAMTLSAGVIRRQGGSLHILGWSGAFVLAARQIMYVSAAVFAVVFTLKDSGISRLFLISYLAVSFLFLTYLHARFPGWLARLLFPERTKLPTIFVGSGAGLEDLDSWIASRGHIGMKPVGFLSDEAPTRVENVVAPYLGRIEKLEEVMKERMVAQVILLDWHQPNEVIENIVEICEQEGVRFLIHNNYSARFAREMTPVEEGGRHFLVMQTEPLEDPINRSAKRMLDVAISLPVVLFVLPPLCLLVAIMQRKQAPGPLFFNRPRGGQNRQPFNMFKFRSMYAADHDISKQATDGDSRIFPFGKLMRKTSIDEFPQFINVLRGDMSVVGPRPHLPQHDDEFSRITRTYHGRAFVKPGITGLAQVRGYRGEITEPHKLHRRVYWDLYYVSRWSLWMDIRVIVLTAWHVVSPPDTAY